MVVGVKRLIVVTAVLVAACGGKSVRTISSDGGEGQASGGATTGGAGATAGTGASGSGGSTQLTSCSQPLGHFNLTCNVEHMLRQHCARSGCHDSSFAIAGLDLTPDDMLVARVLNVPATFMSSQANGAPCIPAGCPEPGGTMLIEAGNPAGSWILQKLEPFAVGSTENTDIGCGLDMPMPPGTGHYDEAAKVCLRTLFLAIAGRSKPCADPPGRPLIPPLPICEN